MAAQCESCRFWERRGGFLEQRRLPGITTRLMRFAPVVAALAVAGLFADGVPCARGPAVRTYAVRQEEPCSTTPT